MAAIITTQTMGEERKWVAGLKQDMTCLKPLIMEEQGSRFICILSPRYVFFFLLSLFLLLINNLHLDYFYRNHDDHDNKWPPSSQCKQGTGQGLRHVMIHLKPEVSFFFLIFFYLLHQ